jgi:hypothetical protein
MQRLSAIDAVSPAFTHAKRQLFQPFRLVFWSRLACIALLTGEFAGGSGSTLSFNIPSSAGGSEKKFMLQAEPSIWEQVLHYWHWVLLGIVLLLVLGVIAVYIASVFRFVLFDAVLTGRAGLNEGWSRWQEAGGRYFLWLMGFGLALLALLALVVGVPLLFGYEAGMIQEPQAHIGKLILGSLLLFLLVTGVVLLGMVVFMLAKDFVVPLMALEHIGPVKAWQRLLPVLAADKGGFAAYVLMKIILSAGSAIVFAVINLVVLFATLMVLGVIGLGLFLLGRAAGLPWDIYTLSLVGLLATVAVLIVLYAIAFASSPALLFFQAYALHFFAPRYPLLATHLIRSPGVQAPITAPPG